LSCFYYSRIAGGFRAQGSEFVTFEGVRHNNLMADQKFTGLRMRITS
jgi:hypothetical protein